MPPPSPPPPPSPGGGVGAAEHSASAGECAAALTRPTPLRLPTCIAASLWRAGGTRSVEAVASSTPRGELWASLQTCGWLPVPAEAAAGKTPTPTTQAASTVKGRRLVGI